MRKQKKFHPLPGIHLWAKITGFSGKQQGRTEKMTHPSLHRSGVCFLSSSFLVTSSSTSCTSKHKWEQGRSAAHNTLSCLFRELMRTCLRKDSSIIDRELQMYAMLCKHLNEKLTKEIWGNLKPCFGPLLCFWTAKICNRSNKKTMMTLKLSETNNGFYARNMCSILVTKSALQICFFISNLGKKSLGIV